jgi:nucleoporin GLE1
LGRSRREATITPTPLPPAFISWTITTSSPTVDLRTAWSQCTAELMDQRARDREDFSSPFRRSYLSEEEFEPRNSEDVHRVALAAAQAEHDRIRDTALQVYAMNELRESQNRLHQRAEAAEERIRLETARAVEETRIRELENAAKRIPKPPPRLPTPPPPPPSPPCPVVKAPPPRQKTLPPAVQQPAPPPLRPSFTPSQPPPQAFQPVFTTPKPIAPEPKPLPRPPAKSALDNHILPGTERYAEIHKELKNMRTNVDTWIQQFDRETRNSIGDLRRGLRTACGQLVVNPQNSENNKVVRFSCRILRNPCL